MAPPLRSTLGSLAVLLATSALAFALVERFALSRERALAQRPQHGGGLELLQANPHGTGSFRLRPDLDLALEVKGQRVRVRTNRFGMHWREVERDKPSGLRRVAFLGDSFTFGCWTPSYETSLVGEFEAGLSRQRLEALNFGVGGYGLDDEELLLSEEVLAFAPDWVIVVVFTGNDFRDTFLGTGKHRLVNGAAELRKELLAERVPEALLTAADGPLPPAADPSFVRRSLERFATFRLLLPAFGWENPWIEFEPSRKFTSFSFWSRSPPLPIALRARDLVTAALERMDRLTREHGARLGVVTIPTREQVYSRAEQGRDFDVQLPQAFLRVFARERGIPYLDLWQPLRERARAGERDPYLWGDIHFGTAGHALAGRWIREWFQAELRPLLEPAGT